MVNRNHEPSQDPPSRGDLLLIGDDGRMAALLQRGVTGLAVETETDAMTAIVRLGDRHYRTVLVNAEHTAEKTTDVVRAILHAGNGARVLLYGHAYSEVYAQPALRAGAHDCLIWPIPVSELRAHLAEKEGTSTSKSPLTGELVGLYRELAQLVPQGISALIEHAQRILPPVLAVQSVHIESIEAYDESPAAPDNPDAIPLPGPAGMAGRMELGPALPASPPDPTTIAEIAAFFGTLLHLATRDESLKRLATTDELTGVYNRRYLEHFVSQVIEQGRAKDQKVTLLLFDVDDLKHYNDTYGHAAGDEILSQAAELMRRCCRQHDVVARIGGDEFAVAFWDSGQPRRQYDRQADTHPDEADIEASRAQWSHAAVTVFLTNRFRRMLRTSEFPSLGPEARGVLTISGGMARFPEDGSGLTELLAKADEALLDAKRSGKDRIYLVGQPDH